MIAGMRKILIRHFPSLNNYGTAMMGLVMSQFLSDHFAGQVEIHADLKSDDLIPDVQAELRGPVRLVCYANPPGFRKGLAKRYWNLRRARDNRKFDLIVILGGDDLSEYYSPRRARTECRQLFFQQRHCPVVLVGQTIGPFHRFLNRLLIPYFLRPIPIIARDRWCHEYLREELKLTNVHHGADLAFCDLPLQHDRSIRQETLQRFGLEPNRYITVIVSGLVNSYCPDRQLYMRNWHDIVCRLAENPRLREKKICLLAHVFTRSGDEGERVAELHRALPDDVRPRVVPVAERIFPTRARAILGEGFLTVTGRMHASVSTFQAGKPAVVLAYSKKFDGVVGENLNRSDLILDARACTGLWETRTIAGAVDEKVRYVCEQYDRLSGEIREQVAVQKQLAESMLQRCVGWVRSQDGAR
jgi:colanic acid/amylovoran biosynthesis protein